MTLVNCPSCCRDRKIHMTQATFGVPNVTIAGLSGVQAQELVIGCPLSVDDVGQLPELLPRSKDSHDTSNLWGSERHHCWPVWGASTGTCHWLPAFCR